ncbi:LuxR C-terminal-related transcriptional regulator [uncultured Sulfitobacter sp.]|uniref:LuxR C-terminal-related transcriptional regulator n=1 Tax=uncultured Sulfitobacter sp. TaxID=191468 RepID=UPI00262BBE53|nr:LuxR C-terminal-related transcriptional regulator [uncultured Sulfitobacter sp.]
MKTGLPSEIDADKIVDQLYDIALDPKTLDTFIGAWNDAGLDADAARKTIKSIDAFDQAYIAHLERADTFLTRGSNADKGPDLTEIMAPFDSLAAFIVDQHMVVVASNDGAREAFQITDGTALAALPLPPHVKEDLGKSLGDLFTNTGRTDLMLRLDMPEQRGPALFQIRLLPDAAPSSMRHALVVTTQYHWKAALGQILEEVFDLTAAEQGVVRALVEGLDAKTIAAGRGTSEGTVRSQIKSILSKMNARSQSEVIRLVLSLRDVAQPASGDRITSTTKISQRPHGDWLQTEAYKPLKTFILPDGRKLDYHDMGLAGDAPILFSHMGYGMARWHAPMLRLAIKHGLRVIVPIRAGYGQSDPLHPKADVLATCRADTRHLLNHLGIARLPYVPQGNDLLFAVDMAVHHPEFISEIIAICGRPFLPGDRHYAGMGKWHRFFLSTARHAPHLLRFTAKAAIAMSKRVGPVEMFRTMNQRSAADIALLNDPEIVSILIANADLIAGKGTDVSQAYAMELLETEADWSHLMLRAKDVPTSFINGNDDPSTDVVTIAEYRETYPWIEIEIIPEAGQLLIYQHFDTVIPKLADAAKKVIAADGAPTTPT